MLRRKCDLAVGRRDLASLPLRSHFIIVIVVVQKFTYVLVRITLLAVKELILRRLNCCN